MSDGFECSICGKEHGGLVTDRAYKLPDEIWALPGGVRAARARFTSDLCQFDDRNFIRCMLEVPFSWEPGSFGWGAWAEVDLPTFERYREVYDEDATSEPTRAGTLANALPAYPRSLRTPVVIQFENPSKRPSLFTRADDRTLLSVEQRAGIDERRYHEILEMIRTR